MKFHLLSAFCLLLCGFASAESVAVKYMTPQVFGPQKFLRAADYFRETPKLNGIAAVRTTDSLEGLYFVTTLRGSPLVVSEGDTFFIHCQLLREKNPIIYSFPANEKLSDEKEIFFGITDENWKDVREQLVAWKLILHKHSGEELLLFKSFSW